MTYEMMLLQLFRLSVCFVSGGIAARLAGADLAHSAGFGAVAGLATLALYACAAVAAGWIARLFGWREEPGGDV